MATSETRRSNSICLWPTRSNRLRELTDVTSWHYVKTDRNPADHASRGLTAKELTTCKAWWQGPQFLHSDFTIAPSDQFELEKDDPEVKKSIVHVVHKENMLPSILERLEGFSSWISARRAIAGCLRLKERLKGNQVGKEPYSVEELEKSAQVILLHVQAEAFCEEILKRLQNHAEDKKGRCERNSSLKAES